MGKVFDQLKRRHVCGVAALTVAIGFLLDQPPAAGQPDNSADLVASAPLIFKKSYGQFDNIAGVAWEPVSHTTRAGQEDAKGWGTIDFTPPQWPGAGQIRIRGNCNSQFGRYWLSANNRIDLRIETTTLLACPGLRQQDRLRRAVGLYGRHLSLGQPDQPWRWVWPHTTYYVKDGDFFLETQSPSGDVATLRFQRCPAVPARPGIRFNGGKRGECL